MRYSTRFALAALLLLSAATLSYAGVPNRMNVQGRLTDSTGSPLPAGKKTFTFKIFTAETLGTEVWPRSAGEDQLLPTDAAGLWTANIGALIPLTAKVFADSVRWLEIVVDDGINPPVMLPRVRLVTGPYAFRAAVADSALVVSGGGGGPFLPLAGGVMSGPITNAGNPAITMGKGNFGSGNTNGGIEAFVAGANNHAHGDYSVVAGGGGPSTADSNTASGPRSVVSGGISNIAYGSGSSVGGGGRNYARGDYSVVAGGGGDFLFDSNSALGDYSSVGGGSRNAASNSYATVSGGFINTASGISATVSGGTQNVSSGGNTVIGGGANNSASASAATVGGGHVNTASATRATVGGGGNNRARGDFSTVAGGGGGFAADSNSAIGDYSTVPGGRRNTAAGDYSLAAGRNAKANHDGTFVWADDTNVDFASTSGDQFLIRADSGVGIGTNSPLSQLSVRGRDKWSWSSGNGWGDFSIGNGTQGLAIGVALTGGGAGIVRMWPTGTNEYLIFGTPTAGDVLAVRGNGRVGIGTTSPSVELHVVGDICATGTIATCSDARFKRNVRTIDNALDLVSALRGVRFDWRNDEYPENNFPTTTEIGVIAQEIETVMPEVVNTAADGVKSVEYANLVALLIEAVKEQQSEIDELKAAIGRLTP